MKGPLQKVEGILQFRRCDSGVDEEDCVIDDLVRIESFVYVGDELNAGGCLNAVTARVRVSWRKFMSSQDEGKVV